MKQKSAQSDQFAAVGATTIRSPTRFQLSPSNSASNSTRDSRSTPSPSPRGQREAAFAQPLVDQDEARAIPQQRSSSDPFVSNGTRQSDRNVDRARACFARGRRARHARTGNRLDGTASTIRSPCAGDDHTPRSRPIRSRRRVSTPCHFPAAAQPCQPRSRSSQRFCSLQEARSSSIATNSAASSATSARRPERAARRHVVSRCAHIPYLRATSETRAPGAGLSRTIRPFNSFGHIRLPERERRKSIRPTNPWPPATSSFAPLSICKPLQGQIRPSEDFRSPKPHKATKPNGTKTSACAESLAPCVLDFKKVNVVNVDQLF